MINSCGTVTSKEQGTVTSKEQGEMLYITLNKTESLNRVSADIDYGDGKTLKIRRLRQGLLTEWNKQNPTQQVEVGDHMIDINGKTGDSRTLLHELLHSPVLQ